MNIVIGIGDFAITDNEEDVIRTHALGSCVALTAYSPFKKVLGMVHIALPDSSINPQISRDKPGHFADTAIPFLLNKISSEYGCRKNELVVNIYGGALSSRTDDMFRIGVRNVNAVKKILDENNIALIDDDTGGFISRTVEVDADTGSVRISTYPMNF